MPPAARRAIDRTGDPDEVVGSTEAARVLGYSRAESLPASLLDRAQAERHPNGSVKRRTWTRRALWRYADTVLTSGSTNIDGRTALDRTGIAAHLGTHLSRVDAFIADAPGNGFPTPVEGKWYYTDDIDAWHTRRQAAKRDTLTPVDRSGDPDELVTKAEAARIIGYHDVKHLDNSTVYAALLARNDPDHNEDLPSGRVRRRWPRRVVWEVAQARPGRRGRPTGASAATRTVDRSGDPDELVGAAEAARVLGYRHPSGLPPTVLDSADIPRSNGTSRRWKRRTLWQLADEMTTPSRGGR